MKRGRSQLLETVFIILITQIGCLVQLFKDVFENTVDT